MVSANLQLLVDPREAFPNAVTADGEDINLTSLLRSLSGVGNDILGSMASEAPRKSPRSLLPNHDELNAVLSPDNQLDGLPIESVRDDMEIYVRPFPNVGGGQNFDFGRVEGPSHSGRQTAVKSSTGAPTIKLMSVAVTGRTRARRGEVPKLLFDMSELCHLSSAGTTTSPRTGSDS